jgi:hypothetical protein
MQFMHCYSRVDDPILPMVSHALCTGSTSFLRKIDSVILRFLKIGQNGNGRARISTNYNATKHPDIPK